MTEEPEDLTPTTPTTGAEDESAVDQPRRHPSTVGGAVYLVILAATLGGLVVAGLGMWRTGVRWVAGALLLAALFRAVLPRRDAGMLAVRSRWLDVILMAVAGGMLWFLAGSIPDA